MSLDLMHLKILKESGSEAERRYTKKIIPLVSHHHLLLVTLLLANAAAMESLPIFLDELVPSYLAIILSVTFILFFGEVIPQAICSKYGLAIGYYIHWFMWFLIALCFVVAYPVAKLLDCILGKDKINFYRVDEIKQLVQLHKLEEEKKGQGNDGGPLTEDEVRIIQGALNMREKVCNESIYTPIDEVFALSSQTILDEETIKNIHACGHSRIPVYRKKKTHIIGILLVKDLIVIDPKDKLSLDALDLVMIPQVTSNTPLYDLLNHFQKGKSHMAMVINALDFTTVVGIVTLEDIIEELLNVEILDERDTRENANAIRISMDTGESAIVYRPSLNIPRPSLTLIRETNPPKGFKSPITLELSGNSPKKEKDMNTSSKKKTEEKLSRQVNNVSTQIPPQLRKSSSSSSSGTEHSENTSEKVEVDPTTVSESEDNKKKQNKKDVKM